MKDYFYNPISPRQKKSGPLLHSKGNFDYDKRSSCFVNMGTDYGVGFNSNSLKRKDVFPSTKEIDISNEY